MRILLGEVVDDVDGLGGGEEAEGGAVTEEAQVAVIRDDVDGGVPGDLGGRRGAGADVVDGANVAAVEADARAGAEHAQPGGGVGFVEESEGCWVGGWCKWGWSGCCAGGGGGCGEGVAVWVIVGVGVQGGAVDVASPVVVHGAEADFVAAAYSLPDAVFGCDEVGEALADLREPDEGCDVGDGGVFEDLDEDF